MPHQKAIYQSSITWYPASKSNLSIKYHLVYRIKKQSINQVLPGIPCINQVLPGIQHQKVVCQSSITWYPASKSNLSSSRQSSITWYPASKSNLSVKYYLVSPIKKQSIIKYHLVSRIKKQSISQLLPGIPHQKAIYQSSITWYTASKSNLSIKY
jgi:hypothetical protein